MDYLKIDAQLWDAGWVKLRHMPKCGCKPGIYQKDGGYELRIWKRKWELKLNNKLIKNGQPQILSKAIEESFGIDHGKIEDQIWPQTDLAD